MNYLLHHRERYPDADLLTYPVDCEDGLTRMISMEKWYWQKLDLLLEAGTKDLKSITGFCLRFATRLVDRDHEEYEYAFFTLFMHYIFTEYHQFKRRSMGIANEFWDKEFDD